MMQPHGYIMSGKEQLVVSSRRVFMAWNRLWGSGIWSLTDS